MTKPIEDMTVEEMDTWVSKAWGAYETTEQEAEAKAFRQCGEFIQELGSRIALLEEDVAHWKALHEFIINQSKGEQHG